MAKAFGLPLDYVLYDMSYANVILYSATLPSYDGSKGCGATHETRLDIADSRQRGRIMDYYASFG